jgi:threonine dehydrogenase-like Zn-dependent dehydrogenase
MRINSGCTLVGLAALLVSVPLNAQAPSLGGQQEEPVSHFSLSPYIGAVFPTADLLKLAQSGGVLGSWPRSSDPRKLAWAEEFGATHVVNSRETDAVEAIRALTDGNGADVCLEAVGRPEVLEQAFYARDLAGTVVQVGVPDPSMTIELPMIEFFGRGGALKPSWYGDCLPSRDFPTLIDLHLQCRFPLDKFVSETIGLDDVEEAFHRMERGEVLRSVVVL